MILVLEAAKSKIKVSADLVPGEGPFPSLQMATVFLFPLLGGESSFVFFSNKGTNPFMKALLSSPKLTLIPYQRPHLQISSH